MKHIERLFLIAVFTCFMSCSSVNAQDSGLIKLMVNDEVFDVQLENNSATEELIKILKKDNVTINASNYGNFEKVGNLGFTLPTNDENIHTSPGDIVLYRGNQTSLFYDSHSWSYTKIGKIQNIDSNKLNEALGPGNVKLVFSLK